MDTSNFMEYAKIVGSAAGSLSGEASNVGIHKASEFLDVMNGTNYFANAGFGPSVGDTYEPSTGSSNSNKTSTDDILNNYINESKKSNDEFRKKLEGLAKNQPTASTSGSSASKTTDEFGNELVTDANGKKIDAKKVKEVQDVLDSKTAKIKFNDTIKLIDKVIADSDKDGKGGNDKIKEGAKIGVGVAAIPAVAVGIKVGMVAGAALGPVGAVGGALLGGLVAGVGALVGAGIGSVVDSKETSDTAADMEELQNTIIGDGTEANPGMEEAEYIAFQQYYQAKTGNELEATLYEASENSTVIDKEFVTAIAQRADEAQEWFYELPTGKSDETIAKEEAENALKQEEEDAVVEAKNTEIKSRADELRSEAAKYRVLAAAETAKGNTKGAIDLEAKAKLAELDAEALLPTE